MASPEEKVGGPSTEDDSTNPDGVLVDGKDFGPESGDPNYPQTDPAPTTSKQVEEQGEGKKESGKGAHNIKSAIIISGVVVAVIGAIFAIVKKNKEA